MYQWWMLSLKGADLQSWAADSHADSHANPTKDTLANILGLIVLGSAVSKISQALADMRANSESDDRQRREIRLQLDLQYLLKTSNAYKMASQKRSKKMSAEAGWWFFGSTKWLGKFCKLFFTTLILCGRSFFGKGKVEAKACAIL